MTSLSGKFYKQFDETSPEFHARNSARGGVSLAISTCFVPPWHTTTGCMNEAVDENTFWLWTCSAHACLRLQGGDWQRTPAANHRPLRFTDAEGKNWGRPAVDGHRPLESQIGPEEALRPSRAFATSPCGNYASPRYGLN